MVEWGMRKILSVEYSHGKFSWGVTAGIILEALGSTGERVDYTRWKVGKAGMEKDINNHQIVLCQNAPQLVSFQQFKKVVTRLADNRTFDETKWEEVSKYLAAISKCRAVIATNHKLMEIAKTVHKHVYLIPNGIDTTKWTARDRKYPEQRPFVVGFSGNVAQEVKAEYKGYPIIKRVCSRRGDVELKGAIYKLAQIPYNQMKSHFYDRVDVVALLSVGEGCSNTLMEACSCGVPIITTRTAGYHGDLMVDGENVIFCERTDKSFSEALDRLLSDPELYERVAKGARKFAEEHHEIKVVAEKYRQVFRECYPECFDADGSPKQATNRTSPPIVRAPLPIAKPAVKKPIVVEKEKNTIVACVLRTGGDYTPEYVHRLKRAVERNLTVPHDFVCFSNIDIPGINVIPLEQNWAGWWSKVELFRLCSMFPGKRYLCLDLDTVIISNIDTIERFQSEGFAMLHGIYRNKKEISGGLMLFKGDYSYLYEMFAKSKALQDIWFARKREDFYVATTVLGMDKEVLDIGAWIKYASWKRDYAMYRRDMVRQQDQVICFHGKPRPLDVKENYILREHWRL
jgi:hypothetical protein